MDQQRQTPESGRAPTAEEIARLEAEAVAAMRRGEAPARGERPAPDFVPYVDDAPEPQPAAPAEDAGDGDSEDDGEYVPGPWEKRIDALTPKQWRLAQIVGGAVVGLAAVAALFVFGEELSTYGLIVAALLSLLLPRYLERAWRRKLTTARYAMAVSMLVLLAILGVRLALTHGLSLTKGQ